MSKPSTSRRQVLRQLSAAAGAVAAANAWPQARDPGAEARLDHLILGVPDLEAGIAWIENLTGVRAAPGGSHPGRGTRNALLSLGEGCYFEIFAPDPAQAVFDFPIDLRRLEMPTLVNWAVSGDVAACAENLRQLREPMVGPRSGSRTRPDGRVLRWKTLQAERRLGSLQVEPVPFMIEWAQGSAHPATDSPSGCKLQQFEIFHPEPGRLEDILRALRVMTPVRVGACQLRATLDTPKGSITIS